MKNIMVCGSRSITNEEVIFSKLDDVLTQHPDMILISGGAKGVDSIAENWAKSHHVFIKQFKPDWKKYGRGAGIVRNKQMVEESDKVIIFWDGISKGTKSDIDFCKKFGKEHLIVRLI